MVRNQWARPHFGGSPSPDVFSAVAAIPVFLCACCSGGTAPVSVPHFSCAPPQSASPSLRYFATVSHPISEEIRFPSPASPRPRVLIVSTVPAYFVDLSVSRQCEEAGGGAGAVMKLTVATCSLDHHTRTQSHVRRANVPQFPLLCVKP